LDVILKTGSIILPLSFGNIMNKWKIIEDFEQKSYEAGEKFFPI